MCYSYDTVREYFQRDRTNVNCTSADSIGATEKRKRYQSTRAPDDRQRFADTGQYVVVVDDYRVYGVTLYTSIFIFYYNETIV